MRVLPLLFALMIPTASLADQTMPMDMGKMDHAAMMAMMSGTPSVTEGGQSAFAAIAQIVQVLETDPSTDWSKVDIESLRRHLIDMDNVTLRAMVAATPTPTGADFAVTSADPEVQASIRRMVEAHAAAMTGVNGWTLTASEIEDGADMTVSGPEADVARIKGLGFIGIMTLAMHHQVHHLMIAKGENPHQ